MEKNKIIVARTVQNKKKLLIKRLLIKVLYLLCASGSNYNTRTCVLNLIVVVCLLWAWMVLK